MVKSCVTLPWVDAQASPHLCDGTWVKCHNSFFNINYKFVHYGRREPLLKGRHDTQQNGLVCDTQHNNTLLWVSLCWMSWRHWKGRLSTVDLLIKVACFSTKTNNIVNIIMRSSKLVGARRSAVLSHPLQ